MILVSPIKGVAANAVENSYVCANWGHGQENSAYYTRGISPHRHDDSTAAVRATPLWCGEEMAESWTAIQIGEQSYLS